MGEVREVIDENVSESENVSEGEGGSKLSDTDKR